MNIQWKPEILTETNGYLVAHGNNPTKIIKET